MVRRRLREMSINHAFLQRALEPDRLHVITESLFRRERTAPFITRYLQINTITSLIMEVINVLAG